MDKIAELAELHILESEAHLRHIDEMLAKTAEMYSKRPNWSEGELRLARFKRDRDAASKELDRVRGLYARSSNDAAHRGALVKGTLYSIGQEIKSIFAELFKPEGER